MILTKRDVQQRVLKDGKPLDLKLFDWYEESRTFKSEVDGLVIDFTGIDSVKFETGHTCVFKTDGNCVFNTGNYCTFNTGNYCTFYTGYVCIFYTGSVCTFNTRFDCTFYTGSVCTFNTGPECTFKTRNKCTFNTGYGCTFITGSDCTVNTVHNCCIINKSNNEVIIPKSSIKITTCPLFIPGYLVGSDYYVNDVKQDGEYMVVDDILSKIISKKGNVFKVNNYTTTDHSFDTTPTYIVQDGDIFAHGKTIEEARESLIYKISNRDTSAYNNLTINSVLTKEEAIKMYRVITGSCEYGVRRYVESLPNVKDNYSIQEIVDITTGQYGNDVLRRFFKV